MKIVACTVCVLTIAVFSVDCGVPAEQLKKGVEECKTEFGVKDGDDTAPPKFDNSGKEICFRACIGRKIGRLANEKLVVEKMLEDFENAKIEEKEKAKLIECAKKANELTSECKVYSSFIKCTEAYHNERQSG